MTNTDTAMSVRTATPDDAGRLISVLAEALFPGPVADWLIPNHDDRRFVFYRYFTHVVGRGLEHGHVETTADGSAVAIWYPWLKQSCEATAEHQEAVEVATGAYAPRFALLEEVFGSYHPPHDSHHYLAFMAVSPEQQGNGGGAALLSNYHRHLDELEMPAYLEATTSRNRDFYLRFGYLPGPPMTLPDNGPKVWRMWRAPSGASVPASFFDPSLTDPRVLQVTRGDRP